jgi:TrpR-related protein YerC/YecD
MNWNSTNNSRLIKAFLALRNEVEAKAFLRDIMTEKEILEFSNRLTAATMLTDNISYVEIEKATGLSSTTIARVAKWLNGKEAGYKTILNRIHHIPSSKVRKGLS